MNLISPGVPSVERQIERAVGESVQVPPSVRKEGVTGQGLWDTTAERRAFLPAYGSRARELRLRELYRLEEMVLVRGAFTGISKAAARMSWEIQGDDRPDALYRDMAQARGWRLQASTGIEYFQEVLRRANFGAGWGTLITQTFNDFLRYDGGGYIEIIAPGPSYEPPHGPMSGLAHIDPLRCIPTGDPLYPVVYYDRWGGLSVLHHTRVIRMVDMEDGDELAPGYGDSALSRAVSIALRQVWSTRYINMRLDDKPSPGVDIYAGITRGEMQVAEKSYLSEQSTDAGSIYGKRVRLFTMDLDHPPRIESYDFSAAPEKFDWPKYLNVDVDLLALALGVDRQELMQLSGGNIGSAQQSEILHLKGSGKTIGYFVQEIERKINDALPDGYTFEFKARDAQEELAEAQKAETWVKTAKDAPLSDDEKRTLLANQVGAIRDAIVSTPRANDIDVNNAPLVAEDNTPGADPAASAPPEEAALIEAAPAAKALATKDYDTTQALFIQDVRDVLLSASGPQPFLDRRSFGVTMRSLLKRYGFEAYKDGLRQGGVTVDQMDPDDASDAMRVFIQESAYINGLADDVFKAKAVTQTNAQARAQMWGKSLQNFNDAGLLSADRNGMYRWDMDPLINEHCIDCKRLDKQVHRLKTWQSRALMPRSSKLSCHGYNCGCRLTKTIEKARGRF
jgi:hypothetical protein